MARISTLMCVLLIACFEKLEAFGYRETVNVVLKSSNEDYDYILGPVFFTNGNFAFLKVKDVDGTPPTIEVSLEIYDESVSAVKISTKKFIAENGSTAINVTSMHLGMYWPVLAITEKPKYGESKTMLVTWDQFDYIDPKLYLPPDHIIVSGGNSYLAVFVRDMSFCGAYNNHLDNHICWILLKGNQSPRRKEFSQENLVWPNMHIDYANNDKLFIRGFDTDDNYTFLNCQIDKCKKLLTLSNVSREVEAYPLEDGLCYLENPGKNDSVACLKFEQNNEKIDRVVPYEKPISLLSVVDYPWYLEIVIVTNEILCNGTDCSNVVLSKIPYDSSKPIIQRHLALKCSSHHGKLLKVSTARNPTKNFITVKYICESDFKFTFESISINNGAFINTTESLYTIKNI